MTTSNLYEAAFYLTGNRNFLEKIEITRNTVYYHVTGPTISGMKQRYNYRNPKVNYHPFTQWCEKLKKITEKEKSAIKGGVS